MNTFTLSSTFIPSQIALHLYSVYFSSTRPSAAELVKVFAAAAPANPNGDKSKKPLRGITKPKPVSLTLEAVVGVKEIPRTQALKVIWEYIKEHNLQIQCLDLLILLDFSLLAYRLDLRKFGI